MSATQGAELGSRAQLGGLFFKERVLRLPTPVPGWARLTIGERSLRILITVLVSLFLIMLALALFVQLAQSRKTHLAEQNRQTLLYAAAAAQHIKQATRSQIQSGFTPKPFTQEDLDAALLPEAQREGRIFAFVNASGVITVSSRSDGSIAGQTIGDVLSNRFITEININATEMARITLASGEEAYVGMSDLAPLPGSLLVIQKLADVMRAWKDSVAHVSVLFAVTFLVLMMLGGAFHWQAAKASEADRTLTVATERLDKA